MRRAVEGAHMPAVDGDDPVSGLETSCGRGSPTLDRQDLGAGSGRRAPADGEDEKEDQERDGDVRERPCGDHGDALPGRGAPVRLRRSALRHVSEASLRRAPCAGRQLGVSHLALELEARAPRRLVVLRLEGAPDGADRGCEAGLLTHCRLDRRAQVPRGRPGHAGKLNHAAQGGYPSPVLDAVALDLGERRRESDVEAPRPHPDHARDGEVPQLVQEDEQDEAGDDDEKRHAVASAPSASSRAARSASTRSSTSRAGSVPALPSVSPTTSGIPRNGRRPARKAATATSFAALKTHGALPPSTPAARASDSIGNVSVSGGENSSVSAVRSSGGNGVAARSGYVSAYEIGTRMSG